MGLPKDYEDVGHIKATFNLLQMAAIEDGSDNESRENRKHFKRLATKNLNGTLTIHEARSVQDYLEGEGDSVIVAQDGKMFVSLTGYKTYGHSGKKIT